MIQTGTSVEMDLTFVTCLLRVEDQMTSPRILIVDDETLLLNLIRDVVLLGCEGARVETASSGCEALERLRGNDYALILSDIQMRGMSGIELVRETRELRPVPTIVLMTGDQTLLPHAYESGAFACLRKPIPWDIFTEVLSRAVEFNRLHRRVERLRQVRTFIKERKGELREPLQQKMVAAQARMAQMREQEWQGAGLVRPQQVLTEDPSLFQHASQDRGAA